MLDLDTTDDQTPCQVVVLDLDTTDDQHGQQEFAFYHGYYRHYILHPLLLFDGDSGDLVTALLRPGHKGAAYFAVELLQRIIPQIRQVVGGPEVSIQIRADSGFATPALYDYCEQQQVDYVIGIRRNSRLEREVAPVVEQTQQQYQQSQSKEKTFTQFQYQANSWPHARRVVAKVEVMPAGLNRRFVLTNRADLSARQLYEHYVQRGQSENFIKALKTDLALDRLSCHRFLANQFRLFLHALAYQMFLRLRDYLWGTPWQNLQVETLRRQLIKIGARVRETTRRIWIHLSSSYPQQRLFRPDSATIAAHLTAVTLTPSQ